MSELPDRTDVLVVVLGPWVGGCGLAGRAWP
jgi:hypothetical protein